MNNYTVSCLYTFLVSDTFNRQVIKESAVSANVAAYQNSQIVLSANSSQTFTVSNMLYLKSDTPLNLSGGVQSNGVSLVITQLSGCSVTITNPSSVAANVSIIVS